MKNKKNIELDVDFIGGEQGLTKDEEKAISEYIKADRLRRSKNAANKNKGLTTSQQRRAVRM